MAYAERRGKGEFPWRVKFKRPDGTEDSASGFRLKQDALDYGREQEADIRRGRWHDPRRGDITLDDYWAMWIPLQDWSDGTRDNKDGHYRNHLKPRWGSTPLNGIEPIDVKTFEKQLRGGRAKTTADGIMLTLRMVLADAVADGLLQTSPVTAKRRRGKTAPSTVRKGIVTTLENVEAIGTRLRPEHALMALVVLFTGMRWGEVIGMRRSFLTLAASNGGKPAHGRYVIDPEIGAVRTRGGKRTFGPPKNYVGRTIELPPFLVRLLLDYLGTIPEGQDLLFPNQAGTPLDKSHFNDRWWRPACDGRAEVLAGPGRKYSEGLSTIEPDLWFHDLRRTHKTWLAEDGVEAVARDERLGHVTPGMDGVYVRTTAAMRARILSSLERRWVKQHPAGK